MDGGEIGICVYGRAMDELSYWWVQVNIPYHVETRNEKVQSLIFI